MTAATERELSRRALIKGIALGGGAVFLAAFAYDQGQKSQGITQAPNPTMGPEPSIPISDPSSVWSPRPSIQESTPIPETNQIPGHFEAPDGSFSFDYPSDWTLRTGENVVQVNADPINWNMGEARVTYINSDRQTFGDFVVNTLNDLSKRGNVLSTEVLPPEAHSAYAPEGSENPNVIVNILQDENGRQIFEAVVSFRFEDYGFLYIDRAYQDIYPDVSKVFDQIRNSWEFNILHDPNSGQQGKETQYLTAKGVSFKYDFPSDWTYDYDGGSTVALYAPENTAQIAIRQKGFAFISIDGVEDFDPEFPITEIINSRGIKFKVQEYGSAQDGVFSITASTEFNGQFPSINVTSSYELRDKTRKAFMVFIDSFEFQ